MRIFAAIIPIAVLAVVAGAQTDLAPFRTVERVIDGDTIVLDGGERVRLIGVDTPETVHPTKPASGASVAPMAVCLGRRSPRVEFLSKRSLLGDRGATPGERDRLTDAEWSYLSVV